MKYEIEIPDLPEGWRPVEYRQAKNGEYYFDIDMVNKCDFTNITQNSYLIVEKIKKRSLILEETGEIRKVKYGEYYDNGDIVSAWSVKAHGSENKYKIWREVKDSE